MFHSSNFSTPLVTSNYQKSTVLENKIKNFRHEIDVVWYVRLGCDIYYFQ